MFDYKTWCFDTLQWCNIIGIRHEPFCQEHWTAPCWFGCRLNYQTIWIIRFIIKNNDKSQATRKGTSVKPSYHPIIHWIVGLVSGMTLKRIFFATIFSTKVHFFAKMLVHKHNQCIWKRKEFPFGFWLSLDITHQLLCSMIIPPLWYGMCCIACTLIDWSTHWRTISRRDPEAEPSSAEESTVESSSDEPTVELSSDDSSPKMLS